MLFAPLHLRFGTKAILVGALSMYFIVFLSWPLMIFLAKRAGKVDAGVITVLIIQQAAVAFLGMGASEYFVLIVCLRI